MGNDPSSQHAQNADQPDPKGFVLEEILAEDLGDRQIRGVLLMRAADKSNGNVIAFNSTTTLWLGSRGNRAWKVERELRNRRGTFIVEYRCNCDDFEKNGRIDCLHVFAERLRREEVRIVGDIPKNRLNNAQASRRPARKRIAATGRSVRSVQRDARVAFAERMPEMIRDLVRSLERAS
jgi:hypothetical protein